MSGNFRQRRSQLRFESLEQRAMLAVTAIDDGNGNVTITGTSDSEVIDLFFSPTGDLEILGDVDENSQTSFSGIANLTINMNGGDDIVTILGDLTAAEIGGNLTVSMGAGSDSFSALDVNVGGDLVIANSGSVAGNVDEFFILSAGALDSSVGGNLSLSGSAGSERLNISYVAIGSDLVVASGAGNDAVNVVSSVADDVFANLGNGIDEFTWLLDDDTFDEDDVSGSMTLLGAETVTLQGASDTTAQLDIGGLTIVGSSQTDHIEIRYADISGATIITTDGGSDYVEIEASTLDVGLISTGAGIDEVRLEQTDFGLMILLGGAGADTLIATGIDDPYLALSF